MSSVAVQVGGAPATAHVTMGLGALPPCANEDASRELGRAIHARRPAGWLRAVERLTHDQRRERAEALRARARELAAEADDVLRAVREARVQAADTLGERQWCELGQYWDAYVLGDSAGAPETPAALAVTRWDAELAVRENQKRRIRGTPRNAQEFCESVALVESERPTGRAGCDEDVPRRIAPEPGDSWRRWLDRVAREAQRRLASTWHSERANAIETQFERAKTCNTVPRGNVRCGCGSSIEVREECANHWVCQHCRDRRKRRYRRRFSQARTATMQALTAGGLLYGQTRHYFAERFLTLTMPRAHNVVDGCQIIRKAWRLFWSRFRALIVRHYSGKLTKRAQREYRRLIRCVRAIEVAEGSDGTGHVHIHAWVVCPYIRAEVIRAMWGQALLKAGFPSELVELTPKETVLFSVGKCGWSKRALRRYPPDLFYPRIDIRMVRESVRRCHRAEGTGTTEPADICEEIIKYICKDLSASGKPLDPRLWADIYKGLCTARIITATHGFWVRVEAQPCQQCGGTHWTLELAPRPEPRATAPPLLALCGS